MMTKVLSLVTLFLFATVSVFAGIKTEKIKVNGNCDMCKARIEKAAAALDGVNSATWDKESKVLKVKFNSQKVSNQQIQTAVAMAGHDTQLFSASDKKYAELPGCCQYQRDENRKKKNHETATECTIENGTMSGACCGKQDCVK